MNAILHVHVCHCVIVAYAPAIYPDVKLDIVIENVDKSRAVKPLVSVKMLPTFAKCACESATLQCSRWTSDLLLLLNTLLSIESTPNLLRR